MILQPAAASPPTAAELRVVQATLRLERFRRASDRARRRRLEALPHLAEVVAQVLAPDNWRAAP